MIIALEGIDGAGKSTLAARLAGARIRIPVRVVATPDASVSEECFAVRGRNPEAAFFAFMIGNLAACVSHTSSEVLVLDRYILSTLVNHPHISEQTFVKILRAMQLPLPTITVMLGVAETTANARCASRTSDRPVVVAMPVQQKGYADAINSDRIRPYLGEIVSFENETVDQLDVIERKIVASIERHFLR